MIWYCQKLYFPQIFFFFSPSFPFPISKLFGFPRPPPGGKTQSYTGLLLQDPNGKLGYGKLPNLKIDQVQEMDTYYIWFADETDFCDT